LQKGGKFVKYLKKFRGRRIIVANYSAFGVKARGAMLRKNITLTALAKELDISKSYLRRLESGGRD
jgi:hypothetical protein